MSRDSIPPNEHFAYYAFILSKKHTCHISHPFAPNHREMKNFDPESKFQAMPDPPSLTRLIWLSQ